MVNYQVKALFGRCVTYSALISTWANRSLSGLRVREALFLEKLF